MACTRLAVKSCLERVYMYHTYHELRRSGQTRPGSLRLRRRRFVQLSAMVAGAALLPAACHRHRPGDLTMALAGFPT